MDTSLTLAQVRKIACVNSLDPFSLNELLHEQFMQDVLFATNVVWVNPAEC